MWRIKKNDIICLALTDCNVHVSRTKDQEGKLFRARHVFVRTQRNASILKAAQLTLDTCCNCRCSLLHLSDHSRTVMSCLKDHADRGESWRQNWEGHVTPGRKFPPRWGSTWRTNRQRDTRSRLGNLGKPQTVQVQGQPPAPPTAPGPLLLNPVHGHSRPGLCSNTDFLRRLVIDPAEGNRRVPPTSAE